MNNKIYDTIKNFECVRPPIRFDLTIDTPVIVRLDGKNFKRITKNFDKPFDASFRGTMAQLAKQLAITSGATMAYTQSDEITLVLSKRREQSSIWFDGKYNKIVSLSASYASVWFGEIANELGLYEKLPANDPVVFDSRAFMVPSKMDAVKALIQRQQDCVRNSVSMAARNYFSHKELHGKSISDRITMLKEIGVDWDEYSSAFKYGIFIRKERVIQSRMPLLVRSKYKIVDPILLNINELTKNWVFPDSE